MKTFKSIPDVKQVQGTPVHDTVRELVVPVIESFSDSAPYRPEDNGYLVLIERDDVDRVLDDLDIPHRLSELPPPQWHSLNKIAHSLKDSVTGGWLAASLAAKR